MNDYESSKEWKLQIPYLYGTKTNRLEDNKNYTVLTYYLVMNRNPGFYTCNINHGCFLAATGNSIQDHFRHEYLYCFFPALTSAS